MLRSSSPSGYFHDAAKPPLRIRVHQVHPRADAEASRMGRKTARGTRDLVGQDAARAVRRARDGPGPRAADAVRLFLRVGSNSFGRKRRVRIRTYEIRCPGEWFVGPNSFGRNATGE